MSNNIIRQDKNQHAVGFGKSVQPSGQLHEKYRNIVFDLGAVLLHFNPYEILSDLFGYSTEQSVQIVKQITGPLWLDMDRGLVTPQQVAKALGEKFDEDKMLQYLDAISTRLKPIPQGVRILNWVRQKGYKTYILSNLSEFCYLKVKDFEFIQGFDGAIYSYQHGYAKPDEQIYKKLLDTYSLNAEECLFIDDLELNIQASRAAGIEGIWCKNHDYVEEQLKLLKII
jgi:HAD superfamily hydrolase (TIGR01509 family)